ncbi:ACP phosphodiesterase [Roseivirga sp. BDSF3-8]|uniref:acyl carrier protein phosphodiesterase n=1 Tax=Roseivirga sp. BDSF3-8 TaxID=3241598 RepID=UPI003531E11F
MNFLGHVFLSGDNPDLLFGNYIGDFVKGSKHEALPDSIQKGVLLHREIDAYTDSHAVVAESKDRLRSRYRHYAGVIVDLYYDHFLASLWGTYHSKPLKPFTEGVYEIIRKRSDHLPQRAQRTFYYMSQGNWMYHYREVEGIEQALSGMARRTTFDSGMEKAGFELRSHYAQFEGEFRAFLPDIQKFVKEWLINH